MNQNIISYAWHRRAAGKTAVVATLAGACPRRLATAPTSHCRMRLANAVLVTVFLTISFAAQTNAGENDAESDAVLIRANHVHTMDGESLSPGMILVRDGKIAEVAAEISVDPMPKVIDVDSVMPGLVNAQSTAGLVGSGGEASREVTPEFDTAGMIDFDSRDFLEALDGGETTIHVMPSTENVVAGWTCLLKTAGDLTQSSASPRFMETKQGVALSMCSDPTGRNRSRSRPDSIYVRQPTNRMGVVWILRNQLQHAQSPAVKASGNATLPLAKVLSGKTTVFGVSRTAFDIQSLLTIADEFSFQPTLVGGHEAYDVIDELAAHETSVIYTAIEAGAIGSERSELFWATPLRLRDAKIPFCIAGDGLLTRMRLAVRYGLSADEAMAAVTRDAATVLGLGKRVGMISPGRDADLIGFLGTPTQPTSSIQWVMVDGQQVKHALQTTKTANNS